MPGGLDAGGEPVGAGEADGLRRRPAAVRAWTTAAGRMGTARFQGVTSASYSWSDGSYTAPSRRARSWSSGVRWVGRAKVCSAVWVAVWWGWSPLASRSWLLMATTVLRTP